MLNSENLLQVSGSRQMEEASEVGVEKLTPEKNGETSGKSFDEELKALEENESKSALRDKSCESEDEYRKLLAQNNAEAALLASFYRENLILKKQTEELDLPQVSQINDLNDLKEFAQRFGIEPIIDLNKEKLEMSVHFPAVEEVQSVTVKYDPVTRSVVAEMITSNEAAKILQNQVSQLERNLAKHDIKLQSLRINPTEGNSGNGERQKSQDERRRQQRNA